MKNPPKSILFVCTGNSCRSAMAEGILKKIFVDKGVSGIGVFSAGTSALDGFGPTENTIAAAKKEDINLSGHKTRRLTAEMIKDAGLVLAMEHIHKEEILALAPEADGKAYLLREYINKKDGPSGYAVPDPIGMPMEIYERVFELIKESVKELVKKLEI